jgi:hypothetical protein
MLLNGNECGPIKGNKNPKAVPIQIMKDQKQLENVEYFNYLGSMTTSDAKCTHDIISRITMAKAAFKKKKLFLPAS